VTPYLRDSSVNVRLGGLDALDNRRFKIGQVRITCLVGPNSAGKTTVFNVITGFPRSSTGSSFNERRFDRWKRRSVFTVWSDGTAGTSASLGVPMSDLIGNELESTSNVAALHVDGIAAGCLVSGPAMLAPIGRLRCAIREHKLAAAAAGKSVPRARALAATPADAFAEPAGDRCVPFPCLIDPSPFDSDSSIPDSSMVLLTMVGVCGARAATGSVRGPFMRLRLLLIETFVETATGIAMAVRQLIHSVFLIGFTLLWPAGPAGEKG
jgi:ABC-type branched-subunit amino acid transport system permease subunit